MNVTLICEASFDGMMTAVYDGWVKMNQGYTIHISPEEIYNYNFFTEYINVETDSEKATKVAASIRKKISDYAYVMVYRACMHYNEDRVDAVVEFLKEGYKKGSNITKDYANPAVMRILEYNRKVANEAHLFKGFIRFREIGGDILFSKISPKCDVIPLITHHFQNRYPLENFIIYDDVRKKATVHKKGSECIIISGDDIEKKIESIDIKDGYEDLWRVFFETIGIKERENYKCQRNNIPKWYRDNMTEWSKEV